MEARRPQFRRTTTLALLAALALVSGPLPAQAERPTRSSRLGFRSSLALPGQQRGRIQLFNARSRAQRNSELDTATPQQRPSTLKRFGAALRTTRTKVCELGRRACKALKPSNLRQLPGKIAEKSKRLGRGVAEGSKRAWDWSKKNPKKAIGLALGTAAMLGTVIYAAPALSAGVAQFLTPFVGKTTATILGTASGGALASGARSTLVHITPMVTGVDPFNAKQLSTDVGMSSTFGFFGFAQAAALKMVTGSLGAAGLGLFAINVGGLVGYEVGKDYLQNRIRNRWANDPKNFKDIAASSTKMELASNLHRCVPSTWFAAMGLPGLDLSTSFIAKIAGDIGGTVWWDRIVNKRNPENMGKPVSGNNAHIQAALTE